MDVILGIVAVVSLVLNYLQFHRAQDKDKLSLKVVPVGVFGAGGMRGYESIGIQVTNLSSFPVVISEVGFELRESDNRWALLDPTTASNVRYPYELTSRRSVTLSFPSHAHRRSEMAQVTRAYARTECGSTVTGTSRALKAMVASDI